MIVWLVISSYRNDEDVARILEKVQGSRARFFERVLIVDSEGTGAIPRLIEARGWGDVVYKSYDWNLGSGANLRERLRIAAEGGADYAYALNHDGDFDPVVVSALLKAVEGLKNLGAAYPLSYLTSARAYNLTGTRDLPLPAKLVAAPPSRAVLDAYWSSSNGALYSTEPVLRGVVPWGLMWMGWEDLEYGWRLSNSGYRQVIVCDAIFQDNYEYEEAWIGQTVSKPAWRSYYNARNLLLAIRRSRKRPLYYSVGAYRILREFGLILVVRDAKWERIKFLFKGVAAGLRTAVDQLDGPGQGEGCGMRVSPRSAE